MIPRSDLLTVPNFRSDCMNPGSFAAMAAIFVAIAWIFLHSAIDNLRKGAVVMASREWPVWIPEAIVCLGATTIALRLVGRVIGHAGSLVTGRSLIDLPRSTEH